MKSEDYARFTRIVFDTAPTGHTLRLLTVPDFVEASLGKLIRLRKKLTAAGDAVRGLFGVANQDAAIQKLENLRVMPQRGRVLLEMKMLRRAATLEYPKKSKQMHWL